MNHSHITVGILPNSICDKKVEYFVNIFMTYKPTFCRYD